MIAKQGLSPEAPHQAEVLDSIKKSRDFCGLAHCSLKSYPTELTRTSMPETWNRRMMSKSARPGKPWKPWKPISIPILSPHNKSSIRLEQIHYLMDRRRRSLFAVTEPPRMKSSAVH